MPLTLISSQALLRVLGLWPSMLQWPAKHIRSAAFSQGLCRRLPEVQLQHLEVARLLLDARADPDHPTCRGDRGRFSRQPLRLVRSKQWLVTAVMVAAAVACIWQPSRRCDAPQVLERRGGFECFFCRAFTTASSFWCRPVPSRAQRCAAALARTASASNRMGHGVSFA